MRVLIVLGTIILLALAAAPSVILPARAVCAPPEPGFIIEADPASLELLPGSSGTSMITVTSIDGFTGIVDITITTGPSDPITATPDSTTIDLTTVETGTFTLTVTVDMPADSGTYYVSVEGASGPLSDFTLVEVNVLGPDFSIEADPIFLTLGPGADSNSSTVTLTSENLFTGTVSLATSVFPETGPIATIPPSVVLAAGGTTEVDLTVESTDSTPVGTYTVSIEGTAGSEADPITDSTLVFVFVKGPDFIMSADPLFLTVIPGGASNSSVITVESVMGFGGTVALALVPPPPYPGFTEVALEKDSVDVSPAAPATATLTVSAASPFTPPFPILLVHVMGTGEDGRVRSTFVFVEVLIPNIELSASPDSLPLESGTSTITVKSLYGFAGPVMLTTDSSDPCLEVSIPEKVTVPLGGSVEATLTITVNPDTPPGTYYVDVIGTSPDSFFVGDSTFVTLGEDTTAPAWPTGSTLTSSEVGQTSAILSWTPATDDIGIESYDILQNGVPVATVLGTTLSYTVSGLSPSTTYDFQVVAYDAAENPAPGPTRTVTTAGPTNQTPIADFTFTPIKPNVGQTVSFDGSGSSDSDGTIVSYSWGFGDGGTSTGATASHSYSSPGTYEVTLTVTDDDGATDADVRMITVNPVPNTPPTASFTFNPAKGTVGQPISLDGSGSTDNDGTIVSYSWTFGDTGTGTGAIVSHTYGSPGTFTVILTVTDNDGGTGTDTRTITVNEPSVNNPPSLTVPASPVTGDELSEISFTVTASDSDAAQTVTVVCNECASRGAVFTSTPGNPTSGTFRWTPTEPQGANNDYVFTFVATDNGSPVGYDTEIATVHVNEVNLPPVMASIGDKPVNEGATLTFTVTATDPDAGQTLTITAIGLPTGASFSSTPSTTGTVTGTFSWTPGENHGGGTFAVTFTVTDNGSPSLTDSEPITITVSEANRPPVLQPIVDQSISVGSTLTIQVGATDPDIPVNTLTFSCNGCTEIGANLASDGSFSWTPSAQRYPGTYTITVIVSDGTTSQSESFTVTVTAAAQAPQVPRPFWEEYWYVLLIGALVLVGIPVAMKVRGKPGTQKLAPTTSNRTRSSL